MSSMTMEKGNQYHSAKVWRIAFFALNNTSTNLYMFILGFVSYYATGIAGLTVVMVSTVLAAMRVFDGITDPIIGFLIDRTETKFGKFRPIMLIGNGILAVSIILMYSVTHNLPHSLQLIFFVASYALYVIGYSLQTACTKGAQTVLTNDPKQRPLFAVFDGIFNAIVFTGGQIFVASYLVGKHGGFTMSLFIELNSYAMILSAIFVVLGVVGIWPKDRKEFFGLADKSTNVRFRDFWPIIKGNRPLQMLVLAASTDKLSFQVMGHAVVAVMLFGILLGDYELSGQISAIILIPGILTTFIAVWYARKTDLKKALVLSTWIGIISFSLLIVMFLVIDPATISLSNFSIATLIFIVLYAVGRGFGTNSGALVIPMIADVSDYETYKTGRYVPGMIGTLFSFVDKLISSLAPALVGFAVALIGFSSEFPQIDDALTPSLYGMTLFLAFGVPILGWIISLIAMRFYKLDKKKMEEIQTAIAEVKAKDQKDKAEAI